MTATGSLLRTPNYWFGLDKQNIACDAPGRCRIGVLERSPTKYRLDRVQSLTRKESHRSLGANQEFPVLALCLCAFVVKFRLGGGLRTGNARHL